MHSLIEKRRRILRAVVEATVLALFVALGLPSARAEVPKELRIGFQKSSVNLTLLKQREAKQLRVKDVFWQPSVQHKRQIKK